MREIDFFPKFNDLKEKDLSVDFHLHSTWTDGKNSVQEIVDIAKANDLTSIAITDHIRKESTYFEDYKKEIDELNSREELNIYVGFEAKIEDFNGKVDVCEETAKQADLAIASVHRYPLGTKLYNASEFSKKIAQEIELELSLAALKKGELNVLGHPGGMSLVFYEEFPSQMFEEIIKECAKNGIAFDLNGRYHKNQFDVLYPLLQKYNPYVSIGTDSHSIDKMFVWNNFLKESLSWQI